MPNYRRIHAPGGTFFFTVNLEDRGGDALTRNVASLRAAFHECRRASPFEVVAICVLPDHLHCVWRLPGGDSDNASRWRRIKAAFSRRIVAPAAPSHSRSARRERGLWQRRFWERVLLDEADLRAHIDYVHVNPLKHGYVTHVADWPWSSFHRFVARGDLASDWGG